MLKLIEFKNHLGELLRGMVNDSDSTKAILCLHGFERTSMEYKFKNIFDKLRADFIIFRFDFSGCVMSEGNFEDITVEKLAKEADIAYNKLLGLYPQIKGVTVICHSLAGCAANKWLKERKPELVKKAVYLGPAWNQKELLKYFYVRERFKGKKDIDINNYEENFDEKAFKENLAIKKRMRKAHYISDKYFIENKDLDYSEMVGYIHQKKMSIHGNHDNKVPMATIDYQNLNMELVEVYRGDHDLERPDMVEQYMNKLVEFIKD